MKMGFITLPTSLTEEEIMLQAKYQKLRKKVRKTSLCSFLVQVLGGKAQYALVRDLTNRDTMDKLQV